MPKIIEVRGLDELRQRFRDYPKVFDQVMEEIAQAQLLTLHENVPPYPPEPASSTYKRTGTLGRTLGSGMGGGASGTPDVFQTIKGGGFYEVRFGSRLGYAPWVIGEKTQTSIFAAYWWRLVEVLGFSFQKIMDITRDAAKQMGDFLKGKGL